MFEWDQSKSDKNFTDRGFDFAYASRIFDGDTLEWEDARREYHEQRIVAMGKVDNDLYVVVYTQRGEVKRIISARPASRRERHVYDQAFSSKNS
jgi:uncharacterized DUF497 family protein